MGQLDRIAQQPDGMGGKACIRGMRVTVSMIWIWRYLGCHTGRKAQCGANSRR